jgi:hypothetical protein
MNEAGLAVEALVDGSVVASTAPDPDHLTGLELVQYGLDRFASADDFASFAERNGVAQLAIPLHFFACDRSNACIVIETSSSGVRVLRDQALGVHALANAPFAVDKATPHPSGIGAFFGIGTPAPHASSERFAKTREWLTGHRPRSVPEAFDLLDAVRVPGRTRWQLVWDLTGDTLHMRASGRRTPATFHLDATLATCAGAPLVRPLPTGDDDPSVPFHPWADTDASATERAVFEQLGGRSERAHRLAQVVAQATRATACDRTAP